MTRNYDVFFVFGKEKKLHPINFFWGVGEVGDSGVPPEADQVSGKRNIETATCPRSRYAGKDPAILDLSCGLPPFGRVPSFRMQISD